MIKGGRPDGSEHTRPTGTLVTIRARDDLDPSSGQLTLEHSGKTVTAVPENVGLCQVVAIGPDVTNVRPGDICFIDFFDVAQGYLVSGEELYLTQAMALRMRLELETEEFFHPAERKMKQRVTRCEIYPLPGYVLTKHVPDRMTVAVTGHDRTILPRDRTTTGIVGGRNSDGDPCTFLVYEEVARFTPGAIQQERYSEAWDGSIRDTYFTERRLKATIQKLQDESAELRAALFALTGDRRYLYAVDPEEWAIEPGDLVCFCTAFSISFRACGENYRVVPYHNLLAVIDDGAILADFNATNPPPPLVQVIGGGAPLLYGT